MNIEKYLFQNTCFHYLEEQFRDLQEKLKRCPAGVDSDDEQFINVLRSSFENLKLQEDVLLRYVTKY